MEQYTDLILNAIAANGNSKVVDLSQDGFTEYAFHRWGGGDGTVTIYGTLDMNPSSVANNNWVSLGTVANGAILKYTGVITGFYAALTGFSSGAVSLRVSAARR